VTKTGRAKSARIGSRRMFASVNEEAVWSRRRMYEECMRFADDSDGGA
jgi:hypothetical protein